MRRAPGPGQPGRIGAQLPARAAQRVPRGKHRHHGQGRDEEHQPAVDISEVQPGGQARDSHHHHGQGDHPDHAASGHRVPAACHADQQGDEGHGNGAGLEDGTDEKQDDRGRLRRQGGHGR
jgi:hypothetical protein